MSRLRVAHVTLGLTTGGQEKLLIEFVRHADRSRFEPVVVSLTSRGLLADALESAGARVIALESPPGLRPRIVWTLKRLFQSESIDVVHTHDERPLIYGAPAARWAGRRVIHTQHHGQLPGDNRNQDRLVRWASRLVHAFVSVSHDASAFYVGKGVPAAKAKVLWNGIDLERFAFRGPNPDGPIVAVARLSDEKNIGCLIRAVSRLGDPNVRVAIAGDGPCRGELESLSRQLGLEEIVTFFGNVTDVPALLARASLFVLPSRSEGISLTLLEAMATGLPAVATRVGGNPEVVVDGQTGLLVPSDDDVALADAIRAVRSTGDAMGRAGRERVERHFDVRKMVAAYERLYVP